MTNDEIQKMLESIIRQQRIFSENMEQLRTSHAKSEARLTLLEAGFINLYNTVTEIGKALKDLTEQVRELTYSQAHTDERLNVLIDILNKGRNGKLQN